MSPCLQNHFSEVASVESLKLARPSKLKGEGSSRIGDVLGQVGERQGLGFGICGSHGGRAVRGSELPEM